MRDVQRVKGNREELVLLKFDAWGLAGSFCKKGEGKSL
jgi:hypothetical protein